jgi:hypothetical protein
MAAAAAPPGLSSRRVSIRLSLRWRNLVAMAPAPMVRVRRTKGRDAFALSPEPLRRMIQAAPGIRYTPEFPAPLRTNGKAHHHWRDDAHRWDRKYRTGTAVHSQAPTGRTEVDNSQEFSSRSPPLRLSQIPIAECAAFSAHHLRGFVPWRLSDAGRRACRTPLDGRHPKPRAEADIRRHVAGG